MIKNNLNGFKSEFIQSCFTGFFLMVFISSSAVGAELAVGTYVGKWKDEGNFSGKFFMVIDDISDKTVTGTVQLNHNGIPCRAAYPFETVMTEEDYLEFKVDSETECGEIHYFLEHNSQEINGKFREVFYRGKVIKAKLQP